jgi:type IV pilus assembly protein PilV
MYILKGQIMKRKTFSTTSAQQGIVLVEAMVAVLLFSVGVLAVVGLQASMVSNTTDSKFRADAAYFAQQKIGFMWADQTNMNSYLTTGATIASSVLPNGYYSIEQPVTGQYAVTIGWTAPGETAASDASSAPCFLPVAHCYITTASVAGG